MFASPGNHQLPLYFSRHPHWQAMGVDALHCPLVGHKSLLCKPTLENNISLAGQVEIQPSHDLFDDDPLVGFKSLVALLVRLQKTSSPALVIPPFVGMFQNCLGEEMPPPRWPLLCTVLSREIWAPEQVPSAQIDQYIKDQKSFSVMTNLFELFGLCVLMKG